MISDKSSKTLQVSEKRVDFCRINVIISYFVVGTPVFEL